MQTVYSLYITVFYISCAHGTLFEPLLLLDFVCMRETDKKKKKSFCADADSLHLYSNHILNYLLHFVDDYGEPQDAHGSKPFQANSAIRFCDSYKYSIHYSMKSNDVGFYCVSSLLAIYCNRCCCTSPQRMRLIHQPMQANMSGEYACFQFLLLI